MISACHLYTQVIRGELVATKLVIGDTMISHSHRRGVNRILRFVVWETHEDGTRTGVWQ